MEVRDPLDDSLARMAAFLNETKGAIIMIAVTDDTVLREHTVKALEQRLPPGITFEEFRYDTSHISLLEGANGSAPTANGRRLISAVGLEALPRDKQTEAIKLLNRQRNQLGRTDLAVVLWLNRALLEEVSRNAADFYSWRSATFFIEPPPDWNKLDSARRSYLEAVRHQNEFVNLQGLAPMRGGQIVQMRMDDIFVPLRVLGRSALWKREYVPFDDRVKIDTRVVRQIVEMPRPVTLPEIELVEAKWEEAMVGFPDRIVNIATLCRERRAVVLGDPGAGKTTLLRYLAYRIASADDRGDAENHKGYPSNILPRLAEGFPLYIRIGEYAQHIKRNPDANLLDFALLSCEARQLPLTPELLKHEMSRGNVVFLLDGLDEISEPSQRRQVAQRIYAFSSGYPISRILVTSRIVGYRESRLGAHFAEFTINPFEDEEIERFAHKWYSALQMSEGASSLIAAIRANPPIHSLASNPLLLTVISLIHYRGTKLPHRRVELYERAAETLVDQWMNARRVVPEGWDARLAMAVILPAAAWHLHTTTSGGLVEENELQDVLVKALTDNEPDLAEDEAQARASRFRRDISEFSGIFLERGLDSNGRGIYGFLHLTFEEYFAARCLTDKWHREGDIVLTPLLHDPRWTEVILLAAGHLAQYSQFEATRFVRAILESGSTYEEILHRDLLMAARCLGDDVRVDADLRKLIESRLIAIYFDSDTTTSLEADLRRAFGWFRNLQVGREAIELLCAYLPSNDDSVAELAARGIGELGETAFSVNVTEQLLKLLDRGAFLSVEAVGEALGKGGRHTIANDLVARLLERLRGEDWQASYGAAYALGELGTAAATPDAINELVRLLSSDDLTITDDLTQWAAARALGRMGRLAARDEVIAQLWKQVRANHGAVSLAAAVSLGQIVLATGDSGAVKELIGDTLNLIERGAGDTKEAATLVLAQLTNAVATDEVIGRLLTLLRSKNPASRAAAALALTSIGQAAAIDDVIIQLVRLTSDADWWVRRAAAEALGELGKFTINPDALPHLLKLLSDEEWYVKSTAATALASLGQQNDLVIAGLLTLLEDDNEIVASSATEALGRLGEGAASDQVIKRLEEVLLDPTARLKVQHSAAGALANLAGYLPLDTPEPTASIRHWITRFWMLAGASNPQMSDAGYVGLRNLVAKAGTTPAKPSELALR